VFGGRRKSIEECTGAEIRALLAAGSVIGLAIFVVTFFSGQPELFCWGCRLFVLVWLVTVWNRSVRELKKRRAGQ
jgi:hypothetical protein